MPISILASSIALTLPVCQKSWKALYELIIVPAQSYILSAEFCTNRTLVRKMLNLASSLPFYSHSPSPLLPSPLSFSSLLGHAAMVSKGNNKEPSGRFKILPRGPLRPTRKSSGINERRKRSSIAYLGEALKAAKTEVAMAGTAMEQWKMGASMTATILKEIVSLVTVLPYGLHALRTYQKLPTVLKSHGKENGIILPRKNRSKGWWPWSRRKEWPSILRDVPYGEGERNLMDIYVPAEPVREGKVPVVFFVHGGVWASGDKWHYSPLATRCADEGVVVVMAQYSLYPEVQAIDQVGEISAALKWTRDNIESYGGDPSKIFIMGHSSGAHLCAMVLWQNVKSELLLQVSQNQEHQSESDTWQPACFIGLAGVFDLMEHYGYEQSRGVAALSCLKPANGGLLGFPSMSPSLLFGALGRLLEGKREEIGENGEGSSGHEREEKAINATEGGEKEVDVKMESVGGQGGLREKRGGEDCEVKSVLQGEASLAMRALASTTQVEGGEREGTVLVEEVPSKQQFSELAGAGAQVIGAKTFLGSPGTFAGLETAMAEKETKTSSRNHGKDVEKAQASCRPLRELTQGIKSLSLEAASAIISSELGFTGKEEEMVKKLTRTEKLLLPPCLLLCSPDDVVVPPTTSFTLRDALRGVGGEAKAIAYDGISHGPFACWNSKRGRRDSGRVAPLVSDVLALVTERVPLDGLDWRR